jgi:hypothetical protein
MLRNPCAYSATPGIGSSLFTLPEASTSRSNSVVLRRPSGSTHSTPWPLMSMSVTVPSFSFTFGNRSGSDTQTRRGSSTPAATSGSNGRYRK